MRDTVQRAAGGGIAVGEATMNGLMRATERRDLSISSSRRGSHPLSGGGISCVCVKVGVAGATSTWVVPRMARTFVPSTDAFSVVGLFYFM